MRPALVFVVGALCGGLAVFLVRQSHQPLPLRHSDHESRFERLERLAVAQATALNRMQAQLGDGFSALASLSQSQARAKSAAVPAAAPAAVPAAALEAASPRPPITPVALLPPLQTPQPPPPSTCMRGDVACELESMDVSKMTFTEFARRVPWQVVGGNHRLCEKLKTKLLHWTERPPADPEFPRACIPAPQKPSADQCRSALPGLFNGVRGTPRTMVSGLVFGWELDLLEIQMANLDNVVDYFAVFENSWSHGKSRHVKPLLWDRNKHTKRFARFAERTFHSAIGVAEGKKFMEQRQREPGAAFEWASEDIQERAGWRKIKEQMEAKGLRWEWKAPTADSDGMDVGIVFGDTDEVPDAEAVNLLKWCRIKSKEAMGTGVTFAAWFVLGRMDHGLSFPSDFPFRAPTAAGLHFAFGNPGFTSPTQPRPGRPWAGSPHALLGGAHLSHYPYLPFIMLKLLSGTHNSGLLPPWVSGGMASDPRRLQVDAMNVTGGFRQWYTKRMMLRRELLRGDRRYKRVIESSVYHLLKCAAKRFPTFWGSWDPRLD